MDILAFDGMSIIELLPSSIRWAGAMQFDDTLHDGRYDARMTFVDVSFQVDDDIGPSGTDDDSILTFYPATQSGDTP